MDFFLDNIASYSHIIRLNTEVKVKNLIVTLLIIILCSPVFAKNDKKQKSIPPGLQKKYERTGELPPGWQKKLVKGEILDDSLYSKARKKGIHTGDSRFEPRLGTEVLRIEDRIIRIKKDTKEILEVFGIKTDW